MTKTTYANDWPLSFALPEPPDGEKLHEAVHASLGLLDVVHGPIGVALLAMVYRAPLGHIDFSGFLLGPSGVGKSELAALAQQHYGAGIDRVRLPTWSLTAVGLQALAHQAKDALLVIDDFWPTGTSDQVARLHRDAELVLGGDDATRPARGRRTATSEWPPMPSRALILATGDELPHGRLLRGRVLVIDVGLPDLIWPLLSTLQEQARRGVFAAAMAGYVQWLAADYEKRVEDIDVYIHGLGKLAARSGPDPRTSRMIVSLAVGMERFLEFAQDCGAINARYRRELFDRKWRALDELEADQARHFEAGPRRRD